MCACVKWAAVCCEGVRGCVRCVLVRDKLVCVFGSARRLVHAAVVCPAMSTTFAVFDNENVERLCCCSLCLVACL
jgi:hypothetical protein